MDIEPISWQDDRLVLLDQRYLPHDPVWVTCRTPDEVASAIRNMVVRGLQQ